MGRTNLLFRAKFITENQQRIRFIADILVITYLIFLITLAIVSSAKVSGRLLWGLPIIFVSGLDIYFLMRSFLQHPKCVDTRISTFIISLGATFGFSVWVMVLFPAQSVFVNPEIIHKLGKGLSLIPYPFIIWSLLCLKDCLTVVPEAHEVVAHGPYKYSRHPLYMCYIVWAMANFMMFPSLPMLFASAGQMVFLLIRLRREERLLLDTFPEYHTYYKTVGLLGRIRR